jgi:hypothetical protein
MRRSAHAVWLVALWLAATLPTRADEADAADKAGREQLDAQRAAAQTRYDDAVRECERGFVVTACVNNAKAERRATLDRVAREQAALDDAQRRRRAEERRQRIAQKQAQQAAAASAAASPEVQVRPPRPPLAASAASKPARRFEPRSPAEAAAADAEAAERAAQAQERRERAQAHEEAVRRRNAERAAQRAPAAPLPAPDGASAAASALR